MAFKGISINSYIKKHLKNNPNETPKELRRRLKVAIADFENGVKCSCGSDIWVIGSASVGNNCFTCLTGESEPNNDFEIDSILKHKRNQTPIKNIENGKSLEIHGFFDDDGNEMNLNLVPKPSLCISCINNNNPKEEVLCNMTRYDQRDNLEFHCFAYSNKN